MLGEREGAPLGCPCTHTHVPFDLESLNLFCPNYHFDRFVWALIGLLNTCVCVCVLLWHAKEGQGPRDKHVCLPAWLPWGLRDGKGSVGIAIKMESSEPLLHADTHTHAHTRERFSQGRRKPHALQNKKVFVEWFYSDTTIVLPSR